VETSENKAMSDEVPSTIIKNILVFELYVSAFIIYPNWRD
jgi:hypothetical protein